MKTIAEAVQRRPRSIGSSSVARRSTLVAGILLSTLGCIRVAPPTVCPPPTGRWLPATNLASELGMQITRSSKYAVSMNGATDALLIMGPPRPGVLLNGRRVGNGTGINEHRGQLIVQHSLAEEIRRQIRQRPPAIAAPEPLPQRIPVPINATGVVNGTVVLDAGHGGDDPGAPNRHGPTESILVMDTVDRIDRALRARGVRVVLTRNSDRFIQLNERAAIANRAAADVFVSIHADSHPRSDIDGFTVYVARKSSRGAKALARSVSTSLSGRVRTSRGTRKQDFRVLVKTHMPAVLIELGYLTNRAEGKRLSTGSYRQMLAEAIADSIVDYLSGSR